MRIFITGASGFVGGATARHLSKSHEILAMSRSKKSDGIIRKNGTTPIRCELNAVSAEMLQGVDTIIHCAAFVEEWGPLKTFETLNVTATQQLLDMAEQAGVRRFIHIGTEAALFHGQDMIDVDETYPLSLNSPFPYSRTKARAEKLVREHEGTTETIVLRPRMIWGPNDQTVLPAVLKAHKAGQFSWIDGGKAMTSSTHIDNLVHGIELAMTKGNAGAVYFILDGPAMPLRTFMEAYTATQGINLGDKSMPRWLARTIARVLERIWKVLRIKTQPPLTRFTACIISSECILRDNLARKSLGYTPKVTFSEGMAQLQQSTHP